MVASPWWTPWNMLIWDHYDHSCPLVLAATDTDWEEMLLEQRGEGTVDETSE